MKRFRLKKPWNGQDPAKGQTSYEMADLESAAPLIAAGVLEEFDGGDVEGIAQRTIQGMVPEIVSEITKQFGLVLQGAQEVDLADGQKRKLNIAAGQLFSDKTKSFGNFLKCVLNGDHSRIESVYMTTKAPLAEATGTGGGYLVPPEYQNTLLRLATERSIVRPRARVIPMGSRTVQVPALKQSGAGVAGQFQSLAGMVATWSEEAQTRPETEPTFRQIELIAHELTGYSVASRTLMADSAQALDALLTGMFADAIAVHEDFAFIQGDGVGKPRGFMNAAATLQPVRNTASKFLLADAASMWSQLLPASQERAVWIMSQSVIPQLIQLQDQAGNVIFLPNFYAPPDGQFGGIQHAMVPMLLGRPILFTEKVPPLGTTGDVMLVDLDYYLLGDRQAIEVAASEHVNFLKNQMTWRFIHRVDGQPWLDAPYSYQDSSSKVSPFVVLHSNP
jgi:HK97 family phage major capsid protein